jgi:hypothetical protein
MIARVEPNSVPLLHGVVDQLAYLVDLRKSLAFIMHQIRNT